MAERVDDSMVNIEPLNKRGVSALDAGRAELDSSDDSFYSRHTFRLRREKFAGNLTSQTRFLRGDMCSKYLICS